MQELVNARLLSNGYGNYSYLDFNKSSKEISIKCDKCGAVIITTMVEIEDGMLSTECAFCKTVELNRQLEHQREIAETISDFDLELIPVEESDYTKENYIIKCKQCGKEYFLDDDFDLDSDPLEMCCKNWDCMISLLTKKGHWFAEGLKTGDIKILKLDYSTYYSPTQFIMDYEDWFDSLEEHNGTCDIKCSKCGSHRIIPFGKWYEDDCYACCYTEQNDFEITKWDKIDEKVYIHCFHCDSLYVITEQQALEEIFDCFKCFEQKSKEKTICPVCHTELPKGICFCDTCGFCLDVLNRNKIQNQEQYTQWLANTIAYCSSVWNSSKKEIDKLKSEVQTLQKALKQSDDSVRILSQTKLDLLDVVDALCLSNSERCAKKRSMRKLIAEANGIVYLSSECNISSICTGVCDKCNAEIIYFNSEIKRLESEGHKIVVPEQVFSYFFPNIMSVADKIKLKDLELSPYALNPLRRHGIKTLGQLSKIKSSELFKVRSLGRRGSEEIVELLSKFGLSLREE